MQSLSLEGVRPEAAERIGPFFRDVLERQGGAVHSLHIVGSAMTEDFNPKRSDINSVIVLKERDLSFFEFLAPVGKKYGKKRLAPPLVLTLDFIRRSADVFPIEFLTYKLIHKTVCGEDIFEVLPVNKKDLRSQCERELKSKLVGLGEGYISAKGERKTLIEGYIRYMANYIPLFRGIIYLTGKEPPTARLDVIKALSGATGVNTDVFERVYMAKSKGEKFSGAALKNIFEEYYEATERLAGFIDEITL